MRIPHLTAQARNNPSVLHDVHILAGAAAKAVGFPVVVYDLPFHLKVIIFVTGIAFQGVHGVGELVSGETRPTTNEDYFIFWLD